MTLETLGNKLQLNDSERPRLAEWNATRHEYPHRSCVHQLIAAQAVATPRALAVDDGREQLSYLELNRRANQLAHHLQAHGIRPGVLVACCLDRSADLIVALLGILKAGAGYLPIDPTYPRDRVAFMLSDANVPVLVTQLRMLTDLSPRGSHVICLDGDASVLARESSGEPPSAATENDLAYVIYTSGSTGLPKGVKVAHRNLLNLLLWHQGAFSVTASDRATQLTSPAFDATGWEVWPYLSIGASVHLPDDQTRITATAIRDWLVEREITITFLPTPLAERVMALDWPAATSLRFLLTGADTLHSYPPANLPFALVNNYGPTEATVVATSGVVPPAQDRLVPPSIGRPIENTQIHILDDDFREVTVGEEGELFIGGDGVACGYLNRPELTAERFIADPFDDRPGARLYRTGDRARHLPDGQIAFLGRADLQVKISGYRIELDEIACVLNTHPSIQTSTVVARENLTGDKLLVAYVVPVDGRRVAVSSLVETLCARLPDYMIPSFFVRVDELPVTPNGKVDRTALPAPDGTNTLRDAPTTASSTPTEERLCAIVAPLLNMKQISTDDNFFLLGGSSLMGAQLVALVAESFGVNLSLRTLFERPTVQKLALEIERMIVAQVESMSEADVLRLLQEGV